jgi:hypothetical protein
MVEIPFAPPSAKARLDALSKKFAGIGSNFIFEFELEQSNPGIDFSLCVQKREMNALIEYWQKEGVAKQFQENETWHRIIYLCLEWNRTGSILDTGISNIWFEFDYDQMSEDLPEPCIFITPGNLNSRNEVRRGDITRFVPDWLIEPVLDILAPWLVTKPLINRIKNCINALPPTGNIFQTGILLSRKSDSLRLCTTMPVEEYPTYLRKIEWPGSFEYLDPALAIFGQYTDVIFLDIDVGPDVLPKVGMECCHRQKGEITPRLINFFDLLIELQLCTQNHRNEIIDWLNRNNKKDTFWGKNSLQRGLSHIKVVLEEDNTASAKVYLSLSDLQDNFII